MLQPMLCVDRCYEHSLYFTDSYYFDTYLILLIKEMVYHASKWKKLSEKTLNMVQITHIALCHFRDDAGFAQSHGVMHTKCFKVFRRN